MTAAGLAAELDRVRERGMAVEREEHRLGVVAVAAVISGDAYPAAIAVAAASGTPTERLMAAVQAVAGRAGAALRTGA